MKRLLCLLVSGLLALPLCSAPSSSAVDEMRNRIAGLPQGEERLILMERVMKATQMNPEGIEDARSALHEAQALQNDSSIAYCVAFLVNHFFAKANRDIDSVRHWAAYALPIAERCNYWTMYFQIKYTLIQTHIYARSYEYATDEARQMVAQAKRLGEVNSQVIAYGCMAIAYQATHRWKEAEEALMKGHALFSKGPLLARKITLLKQLLTYLDAVNRYADMKPYLIEMKQCLDALLEQAPTMASALNDFYMLSECYAISCGVYLGQLDEAEKHIESFRRYVKKLNYQPYYVIYTQALTSYYMARGEFDKALAFNDSALQRINSFRTRSGDDIYCLEQRADIYYRQQLYAEARALYGQAGQKRDSLSKVISDMQMDEYGDMYHLDKLRMEKEQMNHRVLWVVLVGIALLLLVAYITVIRLYHLKQALKRNRQAKCLALQKVEEANEEKRRFLTDMSHAIRVPLNSVMGFSQLLATEEGLTEEEVREYGHIVQQNTELLMFQVNSILDLSRLEAGMTKWKTGPCDLLQLLRDAVTYVHQSHPSLPVSREIPQGVFEVETDSGRLMSLFRSLLCGVVDTPLRESDEVHLTVCVDGLSLHGKVEGSPLADASRQTQNAEIQHQINGLTLAYFAGRYLYDAATGTIEFWYHLPSVGDTQPHSGKKNS